MKKILVLIVVLVMIPFLSEGCPMCQGGTTGGTINAYRGTTIFLVLLPFITGYLVYRYIRRYNQ